MLDFPIYNPQNWFWYVGGDTSRAWSSAVSAYVESSDVPMGRYVTPISAEKELCDVLAPYGLSGPGAVVVVPEIVGLWAARAVMRLHGHFGVIDDYVETHKTDSPILWEAWNMGNTLARHGVFVIALSSLLPLDGAAIDALFVEADAIQA